jgi:Na+/proline symporter
MGLGALVHGMATMDEANYLINHTDEVVGFMLDKFDNKLVSGICVAGLFAAGMSSLASVIIIIGTAFVKDIWHVAKPMKESKIIPRTKWFMAIYCIIVFLMTLYPMAGIVELTAFAGAVFAASFFPAIFGGLYLKWGTDLGAMASMVMGMITNIVWRFVFRFNYEVLKDIHEVIPAFIIAMLTYVVVSLLSKNRKPDEIHLKQVFGK